MKLQFTSEIRHTVDFDRQILAPKCPKGGKGGNSFSLAFFSFFSFALSLFFLSFPLSLSPSVSRLFAQLYEKHDSFPFCLFFSHSFSSPLSVSTPLLFSNIFNILLFVSFLFLNLSPRFISTLRPSKEIGYSVSYQHCRN